MSSRSEDLSTGTTRPPLSTILQSTRSSTRLPYYQQFFSGTYSDGKSNFHTSSGTYGGSSARRITFGIPDEDEVLGSAIKQLEGAANALEGPSEAIRDFPKANPAKKRHLLCPDHMATLYTILQNFGSVKRNAIAAAETWKPYMSAPSEEFLKAYKKFRKAYGTERKALMKLCLSWELKSERAMVEGLKIPRARDLII